MLRSESKSHEYIVLAPNSLWISHQMGHYGNYESVDSQPISKNRNFPIKSRSPSFEFWQGRNGTVSRLQKRANFESVTTTGLLLERVAEGLRGYR